jgi:chitinase
VARGVPASKIVVGKPATQSAADSASYISPQDLAAAIAQEHASSGWQAGVMLYEFASDPTGSILRQVVSPLAAL